VAIITYVYLLADKSSDGYAPLVGVHAERVLLHRAKRDQLGVAEARGHLVVHFEHESAA